MAMLLLLWGKGDASQLHSSGSSVCRTEEEAELATMAPPLERDGNGQWAPPCRFSRHRVWMWRSMRLANSITPSNVVGTGFQAKYLAKLNDKQVKGSTGW